LLLTASTTTARLPGALARLVEADAATILRCGTARPLNALLEEPPLLLLLHCSLCCCWTSMAAAHCCLCCAAA